MNKKFSITLALIMAFIFALGLIFGSFQAAPKVVAEEEASQETELEEEKAEETEAKVAEEEVADTEAVEDPEEPIDIEEGKVEAMNGRKTILVHAQGVVNAKPDIVRITLAVSEQAETAKEASDSANEKMQEIFKTLMEFGVAKEDIKTQNVYLMPLNDYSNNRPERYGYQIDNRIQVTLREPEKAGEVIAAALDAGVNSMDQIEYALEDPTEVYQEALKLAVEKAKEKAGIMADAANVKIDIVPRYISEGSVQDYRFHNMMMETEQAKAADMGGMGGGGAIPAPLSQETISISAMVEAVYDIIP